ncbi:eukaryotic translation initiation factor 3 subunit G-like [Corticium candelabrum]|uniref:eukaryotic translation initiation factor 3 subunit G-like n=1 Tax=Corticium candelabrum TaxID=121492 RepID=UPI002E257B50|nr:eukaryotic translation initiation factor 3 subunit G-like [Corticium candelabrum]
MLLSLALNLQCGDITITRTYRIEKRQLSKKIAQRKTWRKFGQAAQDLPSGPDLATTQVADDVFLTLATNKETLEQDDDPLKKLQGQKIVQCRICKGDHWTTKCPYKDMLGPIVKDVESESKGGQTEARVKGVAVASGKYIAPGRREEGGDRRGESMSMRRDDQATLRVTNLSDETTEADLQELFRRFGAIARIYLAKDKITQRSKGFAFVNYHHKEDAARAIQALNGYGYDHLILSVEWARPSPN